MAKLNEKQLAKKEAQIEKERGYLRMFTRIYVVFVLSIYPLYFSADRYTNIVYRKAHVYWIFSMLFIIGFLLFYIPHALNVRTLDCKMEKIPFWKKLDIADWALAAFLLIATVSSFLSEYQEVVWLGFRNRYDGWLTLLCMTVCCVIVSRWYRPSHVDLSLFAISSMLVSLIALLQFYSIDIFKLYPVNESTKRYFGFEIQYRTTIGNIDFVGCYACIAVLVFAALYVKTERKIRFLYFFASAMAFVLLMVAQVDQGKVGVAGACILLLPFWMAGRKTLGRFLVQISGWGGAYWLHHWFLFEKFLPSLGDAAPRVRLDSIFSSWPLKEILILSTVGFAVGLALCLIKNLRWPNLKTVKLAGCVLLALIAAGGVVFVEFVGRGVAESDMIYQAREIMHGNMEDRFGSWRGFTWKRALARIPEHPLLGTGADTFYYGFGEENQDEAREVARVVFDKAHNDFLQISICFGISGLLAYLALIISIFIFSIRLAFYDEFTLAVAGGALAYVVNSFFGIDTVIVTPIYWLLLAMAHGCWILSKKEIGSSFRLPR